MTPYAELLVRPLDGDDFIRRQFHQLSRDQHPDRDGADGKPGPRWYDLVLAYNAVKTAETRERLRASVQRLSGWCARCQGLGVTGSRVGKSTVKICTACKGEGRVK